MTAPEPRFEVGNVVVFVLPGELGRRVGTVTHVSRLSIVVGDAMGRVYVVRMARAWHIGSNPPAIFSEEPSLSGQEESSFWSQVAADFDDRTREALSRLADKGMDQA